MATTADNVRVGVTGAVYVAPSGTALPTTATVALNAAFEELGFVSDEGVTESQATDNNDVRAWQNGAIVRRIQTTHDLTYNFTCIETNDQVLDTFYGNYTGGTVQVTGTQPDAQAWVIDVIDGSERKRIVIPSGQLTDREDVVYANTDVTGYGMTITCYPDASDVKAYQYILGAGS